MATSNINNDLNASLTQVFKVSVPDGVSGVYLTRIDLFFKKKSSSFGLQVSLVELTNGLPDVTKVVPNSTVTLSPDQVSVSADATVATSFYFPQIVFLKANYRYAFVLRSLGNSPDYEIWTGLNGKQDITTGNSVSSNPLSESAYFAKNSSTWSEIPNEDIKYKLYRAKFNTANNSQVILKKSPTEIIKLSELSYASGIPDIRAGDEVYGITGSAANTAVYAKVVSYDNVNNLLYLRQSTGLFTQNNSIMIVRSETENSNLESSGVLALAVVDELHRFPLHSVVPKIGNVTNSLGTVSFEYRGTYLSGTPAIPVKETANSDWKPVVNQEETDFYDKNRYVLCRSDEVASLAGNSSVDIRMTFSSNNDFVSPVIDLKERSIISLRNLINANTDYEDGSYGLANARYISKVITLADGMDAEDLQVYLTAYKPPKTNVQVYAKVWNSEDPDDFDKRAWTLLTQVTSASLYSDPKNPEDYREYEFRIPNTAPVSGAAYSPLVVDTINGDPTQYITNNGTFIGFKKYSIKVVLSVDTDDDSYLYPRINDIRAIALQK